MKAILFDAPGDPDVLYMGKCPVPDPAADELLVHVSATALNRADTMQRQGHYPPPPGASTVLGLEISGRVVAQGSACTGWSVGDPVMGLLAGGGYAEYAVLHHRLAMPIPTGLDVVEAAAIPEVFLTAYQALFLLGGLKQEKRVLVHAGASGVGTAAIQLAVHAGATVFVTASASKHGTCRALGAELAVDYRADDFLARILENTEGRGVDVIIDCVGGPYFERNVRALAMDGTLVLIAMLGGSRVPDMDLRALFRKRARVVATTLRNRSVEYKIALAQKFARTSLPLFDTGRLRPVIDSVYDWTDVAAAHQRMEANENVGKILLHVHCEAGRH